MKHDSIIKHLIVLFAGALLLTSCARQISPDVYVARQVGEVSRTYPGVVRNVREVCMEHGERLGDNEVGAIGGGVTGGVIGGAIGKGNLLSAAAGVAVGAVTGSLIERNLNKQSALEYIVQLDNGDTVTVVQGKDHFFNVGQPVYLIASPNGRSRLIAQ